MNHERLMTNMEEVHSETHAILDNMKCVKGERHCSFVRILLLVSGAAEIYRFALSSGSMPKSEAGALTDAFIRTLHGLLHHAQVVGGMSDDEIHSAIVDATAIEQSVSSLARKALNAAGSGAPFGEGS